MSASIFLLQIYACVCSMKSNSVKWVEIHCNLPLTSFQFSLVAFSYLLQFVLFSQIVITKSHASAHLTTLHTHLYAIVLDDMALDSVLKYQCTMYIYFFSILFYCNLHVTFTYTC